MSARAGQVLAASLVLLLAGPAQAGRYQGSKAQVAAKAKGHRLLKELDIDIDGDGKAEIAVAEQVGEGRIQVELLRMDGAADDEDRSFSVLATVGPKSARRLERFEAKRMAGRSSPELLTVFEDPSPDETSLHISVLSAVGAGVRAILDQTFVFPKEGGEKSEEVSFGDAAQHYAIVDLDEGDKKPNDDLEVVWVRDAQRLKVQDTQFIIGLYRRVYRYDPAKELYAIDKDNEVVDFLPPHPASEVSASAQVGKVWGTAQPFWAADDDLNTSWNLEASKAAIGQALTVKFKDAFDLHMVRVVPGCGATSEDWDAHARIASFRLVLSSGKKIEVDRGKLTAQIPGAKAVGEFPLEGGYGAQVLIMLGSPENVRWAKLEVVDLDPSVAERKKGARPPKKGRGPEEACLSEISFH